MINSDLPLVIEFVSGTKVFRESTVEGGLTVVQNGPPGTSILFSDGSEVPLPSDQIVETLDHQGSAVVGLGGMKFVECKQDCLIFHRFEDLWPEHRLSPERGFRMTLMIKQVQCVYSFGSIVWYSDQCLH